MENLKFIHNTIVHWIDKTDSKANIILAIKLFIVGYFLTLLDGFGFGRSWESVALILFLGASFTSFVFVVKVIYPKLSTEEASSLIYFKHLSQKYKGRQEKGVEDLVNFTEENFKKDVAHQIIALASVADGKYHHMRMAITFLLVEVVALTLFNLL